MSGTRERGAGKETGRVILEEQYNLEDALVIATFLNTFINHAHIVKITNLAQLVNVIAPIMTKEAASSYRPFTIRSNCSPTTPAVMPSNSSSSPQPTPANGSVTFPTSTFLPLIMQATLVLNVVNRHPTAKLAASFELEDKKFGGNFEVSEVNGPDIKSQNTFSSSPVKILRSGISTGGTRLRHEFAPHSYTMLKGNLS